MSWQLLSLANVALGSTVVPLQRLLLRDGGAGVLPFIMASQALTGALLVPLALAAGFRAPDFARYWLPILVMFVLYSAGHVLYAATLRAVEASVFATLLRTSTIWVVTMGYVLFDETVRAGDLVGTGLVLVSIGLLAEWRGGRRVNRGVVAGIAVGMVFGVASSAWVYVGREADLLTWTAISFLGTPVILSLLRPGAVGPAVALLTRHGAQLAVLAVVWAGSNVASLAAFQRGPASLVAPVQATGVVVTAVIAVLLLQERRRVPHKLGAAVVSCIGVVLIVR